MGAFTTPTSDGLLILHFVTILPPLDHPETPRQGLSDSSHHAFMARGMSVTRAAEGVYV